jgi:hypothetical protein
MIVLWFPFLMTIRFFLPFFGVFEGEEESSMEGIEGIMLAKEEGSGISGISGMPAIVAIPFIAFNPSIGLI